jgi:hypothetical protein
MSVHVHFMVRAQYKYNRILFILLLCIAPFRSDAQFTYIGGGLGYTNVKFSEGGLFGETTRSNNVYLGLNALHRPLRFLAVGLEVNIPLTQGGNYSFADAPNTSTFSEVSDRSGIFNSDYQPQFLDYSFVRSTSATLLLRIIEAEIAGLFLEARLSYFGLEETFQLRRGVVIGGSTFDPNPPTAPLNIFRNTSYNMLAPGMAVGMMPHIDDHLFFHCTVGLDFFFFENRSFSENVIHYDSFSDTPRTIIYQSQAVGTKTALFASFGFGYIF